MNTEVQIYINKLRKYLSGSEKAREMFLSRQLDLDTFLNEVEKVSLKNVEEGRDPQLTKDQYEEVRKSLSVKEEIYVQILDGFPPIFLN